MGFTINVSINFNDGEIINLTANQLIEVNYAENTMDSTLSLNPGICEQNASIKFFDNQKRVINRFATNKTTDAIIVIQEYEEDLGEIYKSYSYYSSDYDVENDKPIVTISCIDNTKILKEITVNRSDIQNRSANQLLNLFFSYLPNEVTWSYFDTETERRCSLINVPNSWHRSGTLEEFLNKICALALLRIYCVSDKFYVMRCI